MTGNKIMRLPESLQRRSRGRTGDRCHPGSTPCIGRHKGAFLAGFVTVLCGVFASAPTLAQGFDTYGGEWLTYGGDLANTRYAPHGQINAENFNDLEIAWRFNTASLGPEPEFNLQTTPLMANGVIYTTAGTRRSVVALDAATGELLWLHRENEGERGEVAPRQQSGRGLAYWSDGEQSRILYVTKGYRMISLDAVTGTPDPGFGEGGVADLKLEADQDMDLITGEIGLAATPIVAGDVVIVGAAHLVGNRPVSMRNEKGYIRGYDVRTGERLWIFHTIPMQGEFGFDTWEGDSASYTGNTGVWTQISVDLENELVFLPVEQPTNDWYGGHRHGDGLFGESVVAVDLYTGERRWHFQLVHHGIWDFDIPSAPVLADLVVDGQPVPAVIQPTKQNWLYVFNRLTGEPVWPIEERPVEASDVPGELASPTQPFVTWPPPYARITAYDMNTGNIVWQVPHGDTPDEVRDHPLLAGMDIPRTGRPGRGGVLATSTLLIAGENGFVTTPHGRGAMLRAYDKATGEDIGAVYMPAPQSGAPMTYMLDGKQYIAVAASGQGFGAELLAYALPEEE